MGAGICLTLTVIDDGDANCGVVGWANDKEGATQEARGRGTHLEW